MRIAIACLLLAMSCSAQKLTEVKRICVDTLSGGATATYIRDMLIAALQNGGAFVITENAANADAVLKGSAEDLVFTDTFYSRDGITARASAGNIPGAGAISKRLPSLAISDTEAQRTSERKHEAFATVRLVNKQGDVIWSTTQESLGAKFRGASADVADKVVKVLLADIEKNRAN